MSMRTDYIGRAREGKLQRYRPSERVVEPLRDTELSRRHNCELHAAASQTSPRPVRYNERGRLEIREVMKGIDPKTHANT